MTQDPASAALSLTAAFGPNRVPEEMQRLKDEGLVGPTGFTTEDNDAAEYHFVASGGFAVMQIGYNFLHQRPYDPTRPFGSLIEAKRRSGE